MLQPPCVFRQKPDRGVRSGSCAGAPASRSRLAPSAGSRQLHCAIVQGQAEASRWRTRPCSSDLSERRSLRRMLALIGQPAFTPTSKPEPLFVRNGYHCGGSSRGRSSPRSCWRDNGDRDVPGSTRWIIARGRRLDALLGSTAGSDKPSLMAHSESKADLLEHFRASPRLLYANAWSA